MGPQPAFPIPSSEPTRGLKVPPRRSRFQTKTLERRRPALFDIAHHCIGELIIGRLIAGDFGRHTIKAALFVRGVIALNGPYLSLAENRRFPPTETAVGQRKEHRDRAGRIDDTRRPVRRLFNQRNISRVKSPRRLDEFLVPQSKRRPR